MPFLDAKALETDPDGMAFLRAVIKPVLENEQAALRPVLRTDTPPVDAAARGKTDCLPAPLWPESAEAVPVA
jgi:hypothetical protein